MLVLRALSVHSGDSARALELTSHSGSTSWVSPSFTVARAMCFAVNSVHVTETVRAACARLDGCLGPVPEVRGLHGDGEGQPAAALDGCRGGEVPAAAS